MRKLSRGAAQPARTAHPHRPPRRPSVIRKAGLRAPELEELSGGSPSRPFRGSGSCDPLDLGYRCGGSAGLGRILTGLPVFSSCRVRSQPGAAARSNEHLTRREACLSLLIRVKSRAAAHARGMIRPWCKPNKTLPRPAGRAPTAPPNGRDICALRPWCWGWPRWACSRTIPRASWRSAPRLPGVRRCSPLPARCTGGSRSPGACRGRGSASPAHSCPCSSPPWPGCSAVSGRWRCSSSALAACGCTSTACSGAQLPPDYLNLRRQLSIAICLLLALTMFVSDAAGLA